MEKKVSLVTNGETFQISQALALAILNGTADKLELEKREKEENE